MRQGAPDHHPHTELPPGVCPIYDRCNRERAAGDTIPPPPDQLPISRNTFRLLRGLGFLAGGLAVLVLGPRYLLQRAGRRILSSRWRKD